MNLYEILRLFGIPIAVTTFFLFLVKKYFGSKIETASQKSLEDYKQKIALASENTKLDFQRKIQDFGLYTAKKHEKYIEFHKLLLEAEGRVSGLFGLRSASTYEEFDNSDLRNVMEKEKFPEGQIEEIFKIQKSRGREFAIEEMRKYLRLIEFQKADKSIVLAKNFYWTSKLYLSDKLDELSSTFLKKLYELFTIYELIPDIPRDATDERKKYREESYNLKSEVGQLLEDIIAQMKNELSIGYYDKIKKRK